MKLRALLLRKKIDDKKKALAELLKKDADFEQRKADLTEAFGEVTDETPEEERAEVENQINQFDADLEAHEAEKKNLEREIEETEAELKELEEKQEEKPAEDPAPAPEEQPEEREEPVMNRRMMTGLDKIVLRENVKAYLNEVRESIKHKRALQGVGLTVPEEFLGLVRQNIEEYSKLYKHVFLRQLSGTGRLAVMGEIPEAVWTECCGPINELDLTFNDAEFNCWKVAGFYAICNANLEDSDIDLAAEIITVLGQAIGRALDKAILYGTGTRMPLGIVTRLVQTSQPADYSATERTWEDLHTSNIKSIATATVGVALYQDIVVDFANAKGKYSRGEKVWAMNETTYSYLVAQAMSVNAAGAMVSAVNGVMPVLGGAIEVLDFIPDNIIIAGYFDLYHLAERAATKFMSSEHVRFLADQTVYKATARYDGKPVIAEAFAVIALKGESVSASAVSFAENQEPSGIVINKPTASVVTGHTLQLKAESIPEGAAITWTSANTSKLTVDASGKVTAGSSTGTVQVTAAAGNAVAFASITITAS